MRVVAGPSGSGKSKVFPIQESGFDWFSVDDRCAELNAGSYQSIPPEIRSQAAAECEAFIRDHVASSRSFAVESTLRTRVAIEQALAARQSGFRAEMLYVATEDAEENVERVRRRAAQGGHSAPPERIREIYLRSLAHLPVAVMTFDAVKVYDNSEHDAPPRLVAEFRDGQLHRASDPPEWLRRALREVFPSLDDRDPGP